MGWRFAWDVLGGPGRNRTTDTRIFNLRVASAATPSVLRAKVLLRPANLAQLVAGQTAGQIRRAARGGSAC